MTERPDPRWMALGSIACVGFLFFCAFLDRAVALGCWLANGCPEWLAR